MTYDIIVAPPPLPRNKRLLHWQWGLMVAACLLVAVVLARFSVAVIKPKPSPVAPHWSTSGQVDARQLVTLGEGANLVGAGVVAQTSVQSPPGQRPLWLCNWNFKGEHSIDCGGRGLAEPNDRTTAFLGYHRMLEVSIGSRRSYRDFELLGPATERMVTPVRGLGEAAVFVTKSHLGSFRLDHAILYTIIDNGWNETRLRVLKGNVSFDLILTSEGVLPTPATLHELLQLGRQVANRLPESGHRSSVDPRTT